MVVKLCHRCRASQVKTEDQTITCVALEGGPCFPCRERKVIQEKIEQLEEEIIKLKAKDRALGSRANEIHDPFIHKLPPEIGFHIFRLSLPTLDFEDFHLWDKAAAFTRVLRLGAVCRKWRELAWATPDLWDTLYVRISPSQEHALVQWLPGLLREWLSRSGMRPLTIFFSYSGRSEESDSYDSSDESTLEPVADLVIQVINLHSGRWQNLHLDVRADIPERFCGSIQPNQLLFLELRIDRRSPTPKFIMKSKPFPTQLALTDFPPTRIDIGWDNVTRATLCRLTADECLEVLRRTPAVEYCLAKLCDDATVDFGTTILPHLRSLDITSGGPNFLDAINVPLLEEWILSTHGWDRSPLPVTAMVSLLQRSACCLKILNLQKIEPSQHLSDLFQAMPSLERLQLHFRLVNMHSDGIMNYILAQIFNSPPSDNTLPSEDASRKSFLPRLQFLECTASSMKAPLFWNHIPQLYRQGHRHSLTLKSTAKESHISYKTALELLALIDEGVDLQIFDETTEGGGDFLDNFRKRFCRLSSLKRK